MEPKRFFSRRPTLITLFTIRQNMCAMLMRVEDSSAERILIIQNLLAFIQAKEI